MTEARRGRSEAGSELIELAIVLPILLLVFAAIIDFGFLFQRYEVITNAAREGARLGTLAASYTTTDIQNRVQSYMTSSGLGTAAAINVSTSSALVGSTSIQLITVRVLYHSPFTLIAPIAGMVGGSGWSSITLVAGSTMRIESSGGS